MKWTDDEVVKLQEMYESGTPNSVTARALRRSPASVAGKLAHIGLSSSERRQDSRKASMADPAAYYRNGIQKRSLGRAKATPIGLSPVERAWWLAGWHDKDIELGNSVLMTR